MRIRPIALGLIYNENKILVFEAFDVAKNEIFYRPLGGGIEFGERGCAALVREFDEELGEEIEVNSYLAMFENIFQCNGRSGHEIVLLYEAVFKNKDVYSRNSMQGIENGNLLDVKWVSINEFVAGSKVLYPEGLSKYLGSLA